MTTPSTQLSGVCSDGSLSEYGPARSTISGAPLSADELARKFHVHYELYPESMVLRDHSIRQVGFCIELHARVGTNSGVQLGDNQCREAFRGLREVSSFLVPAAEGDCCYDVGNSPHTLCYHGNPQEGQGCVRLEIRVLRREGWEHPGNGTEARALRVMQDRLQVLRVPRGPA